MGIFSGIVYSILGILAVRYIDNPKYTEKYINWSLWWCLDRNRYSERGKIYCNIGFFIALIGIFSWVIFYKNR